MCVEVAQIFKQFFGYKVSEEIIDIDIILRI